MLPPRLPRPLLIGWGRMAVRCESEVPAVTWLPLLMLCSGRKRTYLRRVTCGRLVAFLRQHGGATSDPDVVEGMSTHELNAI